MEEEAVPHLDTYQHLAATTQKEEPVLAFRDLCRPTVPTIMDTCIWDTILDIKDSRWITPTWIYLPTQIWSTLEQWRILRHIDICGLLLFHILDKKWLF